MGGTAKYKWISPVINAGDMVTYKDHRGRKRAAECMEVSTLYNEDGEAWHTYTLRPQTGVLVRVTADRLLLPQSTTRKARG